MNAKWLLPSVLVLGVIAAGLLAAGATAAPAGDKAVATAPASAPATSTAPAGVVNKVCPIMGNKIDPAKVPDNLTRMYKGQKVGFCCGGCPAAWDKLSDAQKDKKLAEAMKAK